MAGEWYHLLYNNVYGIRAAVLRLTNTYGPRMRVKDARQTFLGVWIKNAIQGRPIMVYGNGSQIRDFNYVDDVVDALLICAASDQANGEIFNLGSDIIISLKETAEILLELNKHGEYLITPFPEDRKSIDIGDYYADYQKIRSTLDWQPKIDLTNGLGITLEYYRINREHYWNFSDETENSQKKFS